MPDKEFKTVSASQLGAMYDQSHYGTRWELYQLFKHRTPIDLGEHERMTWGKRMQPLILEVLAEDKRLEIIPNEKDRYIRRGIIGCTRDAEIRDPSRGFGALEIKCVFDYKQYGEKWDMGERVPIEYELQMQAQLGVGDGTEPYQWGVFAVWVCGSMNYFERKFDPEIWGRLNVDVAQFFDDIARGNTPAPAGAPTEYEWIKAAFPVREKKIVQTDDAKVTEIARLYEYYTAQKGFATKTAEQMRTRLLALMEDADTLVFPFGRAYCKIAKNGAVRLTVSLSPDIPTTPDILDPAAYEAKEQGR